MLEPQTIEQLHLRHYSEIQELDASLERLSVLYRNFPVTDTIKRRFLDKSLKEKSAWYACLVNSNIDVLLLPEYLESKLSRNILIKKETEQYLKSIANFNLLTTQDHLNIYDCILFNEEVKPKSSFDLFSTQVPDTAICPEQLKCLFESWNNQANTYPRLESLLFQILEWHQHNNFNFSNQRQFVLWINFMFWKQFGPVTHRFNLENFLFGQFNTGIVGVGETFQKILNFIHLEIRLQTDEIRQLYRNHIEFDTFKSKQKIVSNHLFESGFISKNSEDVSDLSKALLTSICKKGFLGIQDFSEKSESEKYKAAIEELSEKDWIEIAIEDDEIYVYLNTSLKNKTSRLYVYQNIKQSKSTLLPADFIGQTYVKPITPLIKVNVPETLDIPGREKRHKAFFG